MDPAQYTYIGAGDNAMGDPGARNGQLETFEAFGLTVQAFSPVGADRAALKRLVDEQGSALSGERGIYQCHHCGAHLRYFAVLRHDNGEHIVCGEQCLDNRFSLVSKAQFDALRKAAELDRQAQRIKTAAREFLTGLDGDLNLAFSRETDLSETFELNDYALRTITDIRAKLWQWGSVSERQVAFVQRLLEEAPALAEKARQIAAERANEVEADAPTGRVTFEGVVIKRVWKESDFGGGYKLTLKVKNSDGATWLVWVSEPSAIETERGDVVQMTATLTRSDKANFAFGKRPSKASVIRHEELGEADALAD